MHPYGLHHPSASRIVHIVCRRNIGKPHTPQQVDDSPTRLRAEPIMLELFANAVPQIMAIVAAHMNATNS